jgi:hypothetical protein
MFRFAWIIFLCCAPSVALSTQTMFPVPKGALAPSHVVITPGVSEQDHFSLNERFPGTSAIEHYRGLFAAWRPCTWATAGWSSFGDLSQGDKRFIHQFARHWVNRANDTAVTVVLRYTSAGAQQREVPDNERQTVVVIRVTAPDAAKQMAELGARCAAPQP